MQLIFSPRCHFGKRSDNLVGRGLDMAAQASCRVPQQLYLQLMRTSCLPTGFAVSGRGAFGRQVGMVSRRLALRVVLGQTMWHLLGDLGPCLYDCEFLAGGGSCVYRRRRALVTSLPACLGCDAQASEGGCCGIPVATLAPARLFTMMPTVARGNRASFVS